ncbi:hypothetical protein KNP414_06841 [Paenibacillus mucilaginosus KNP414]|uniref:Copper amine oxidase-like N-terminal domain-containing protein n=2 Tax=Paenibacillus mucilaginosus TaxID=61624 RepID=F8FEP3_PAEMK|nr:hypothetical protein KNP414_06841 [Paenibacillus mucilaginosus KNP414]
MSVFLFLCSTLSVEIVQADESRDLTQSSGVHTGWIGMAAGGSHRLAIKQDGTLWAWGANHDGQLGLGNFSDPVTAPVQVSDLKDVVAIGAGNVNSYAILKDGSVWSWGDNTDGQVGDGSVTERQTGSGELTDNKNRNRPIQLSELKGIVSLTGDFAASYALQSDGSLWGWGFISVPYQTTPKKLTGWSELTGIATGYTGELIGVKRDGTVHIGRSRPVKVPGIDQVKSVATSPGAFYALREDGSVWAWGHNYWGEMGDGTTDSRTKPAPVPNMKDVVELQATQNGPVYLKKDGTVWTHGSGRGASLGNGSYEDALIPVQVKGLTHITHISASGVSGKVMALREDGTLWSWGDGYTGDGTQWWRTVPVQVKSDALEPSEDVDTIKVDLNGSAVRFDTFPVLNGNTAMVPMRRIFELLGADMEWDESTSTVMAVKGETMIRITIGSDSASIGDRQVPLDKPATLVDGLTLVPVRFIAETFGAEVVWDEVTHTIQITTIPVE